VNNIIAPHIIPNIKIAVFPVFPVFLVSFFFSKKIEQNSKIITIVR